MALRQLAERAGGGVVVQLYWDDSAPAGRDVIVAYRDELQQVSYNVCPPRDRALEAFYHPNAFADPAALPSPGLRATV